MITAQIIKDSMHPSSVSRLTTYVLTYPRFLHAEFMTHRVFSRNAQSSRAVPVLRRIQAVIDNPAIPLVFTKNKAGMQGGEPLADQDEARRVWLEGRDEAVKIARKLAALEVHKQYANRVIEPYDHISVVVSATDWENFFALRIHPKALPEIAALAELQYACMQKSVPRILAHGDWHLPFVSDIEIDLVFGDEARMQELIYRSVACCARVSYLNHDGKQTTVEEDFALYHRLLGEQPIHASPAEHQATPLMPEYYGNFYGWKQHRKFLAGENARYTGTGRVEDAK